MTANFPELDAFLAKLDDDERAYVYQSLRALQPPHPLEKSWNTTADLILAAIARAGDFIQRGVRGLLAEAAFEEFVLPQYPQFSAVTPPSELAYDFMLATPRGDVRIQAKNQRLESKQPLRINSKVKGSAKQAYAAETQKSRTGKDAQGEQTRAYRDSEFDILAVCMHPSSGSWDDFQFTLTRYLRRHKKNPAWLDTLQPVPIPGESDPVVSATVWTADLAECVGWFFDPPQARTVESLLP